MARPGVVVTSRATPPPRGLSVDSGVWFVVGAAQKGPITGPALVRNMSEFELIYGSRQTYSLLWDSLDAFFREGGSKAYVSRVADAAAVAATVTLADASAGNSLKVSAANPGAWGNSLSVAVVAGTGSERILVITHSTLGEVDRSPAFDTQAALINWSLNSDWVRVTLPTSPSALVPAVVSATALTSGADTPGSITDSERVTALNRITRAYGPGQVSVPGNTASTVRTGLLAHARANNRQALLDATDTGTRSSLVTEGNSLQGDEYGALFAPWPVVPGLVLGSTRTVPPCALVAGLMARSDSTNGPNVPAAGDNGVARYAFDLSQAGWSDADRELLNEAGVNVIRSTPNNGVQLYGYRTLARPTSDRSWLGLGNQRLRNKIAAECEQIAEGFLFDQIDGKGRKIAEFHGALVGLLNGYHVNGSLYGDTADEAFFVDTGDSVNTPTTLANNELRAVISLRMSPFAELVQIEIVKVSIQEVL